VTVSAPSYVAASFFARAIAEFGALWHGCDWGTHAILGANSFDGGYAADMINTDADLCERAQPLPDDWRLAVTIGAVEGHGASL
jgi:hypothetical protein